MSILMQIEGRAILLPRLMKTYNSNQLTPVLRANGLLPNDGPYILEIGESGGISLKTLAERISIDRGMTTRTIGRLIDRGMIENRSTDGRVYSVWLTPAGENVRQQIIAELEKAMEELLTDFTPEERKQLQALMQKLTLNVLKASNEADL